MQDELIIEEGPDEEEQAEAAGRMADRGAQTESQGSDPKDDGEPALGQRVDPQTAARLQRRADVKRVAGSRKNEQAMSAVFDKLCELVDVMKDVAEGLKSK